MTKKQISSIRPRKGHRKCDRTDWCSKRERVELWFAMTQVALLSVIFLAALVQQDTELMDKALPVLIIVVKLALRRVFNEESKKKTENAPAKNTILSKYSTFPVRKLESFFKFLEKRAVFKNDRLD